MVTFFSWLRSMQPALSYYDRMQRQYREHIAVIDKTSHPLQVELELLGKKKKAMKRLQEEQFEDATFYYSRSLRENFFIPLLIFFQVCFVFSLIICLVWGLFWGVRRLQFESDMGAKTPTLVFGGSTLLIACFIAIMGLITYRKKEQTQDTVV